MRVSIDGVAGACGVAALLFITTAAAAPAYDHHIRLTPENSAIGNFPAQKAPILTIESGDTVRFDTGGGAGWQRDNDRPRRVARGAQPMPVTADDPGRCKEIVEVLAKTQRYAGIEARSLVAWTRRRCGRDARRRDRSSYPFRRAAHLLYGTVSTRPGRGGIPDEVPRNSKTVTLLDLKRNVGVFDAGIEVPLGPFMGVMGLQPPERGAESTQRPARHVRRQSRLQRARRGHLVVPAGVSPGRIVLHWRLARGTGRRRSHGQRSRNGEYRDPAIHSSQGNEAQSTACRDGDALHGLRSR